MIKTQNTIAATRKNCFIYVIFMFFIIIGVKLYQLQILEHNRFSVMADANQVRVVPLEAPRGIIYDRNGEIIADNRFQYNICVIPFEFQSSDNSYEIIENIIDMQATEIRKRVERNWEGRFSPATILKDVNFKTLTKVEEHKLEIPGVIHQLEPLRLFHSDANLSHVIGYLREVSREEVMNVKDFKYKQGDLIGSKGIEREYEKILRGYRGYEYIQVNAQGREMGAFRKREKKSPESGKDLYLTIDLSMQKLAESLMEEKRGATVVIEPETGEILAFVSKPDYSPNLFSGIVDAGEWQKLTEDEGRPLYNRVTQGMYPPGSAFKMIAAIVALEHETVSPSAKFNCVGRYRLGRRYFECWNLAGHGFMDMHEAIVQSCNVYFYNLIRKIDLDDWAEIAALFKFGQKTNIDLPGESVGVLPNTNWMNKKYGEKGWTEGQKLNLVIGQGDLLVTPIQMARFISTLATRGKILQPHLGLKYYDKKSQQSTFFSTKMDSVTEISETTWDFIHKSMYDVVNGSRGTARGIKDKEMDVYGKTGTAQNPHGEPHAWFVGFAKYNDRGIAAVTIIENGGHGGSVAAPIVDKLFQHWKENIKQKLIVSYENIETQE